MKIIFENDQFIVIDKPAGQVVIRGRGLDEGEPLVDEVGRIQGIKPWVVHRLDKETSGLILFAKDPESHRNLSRLFEIREVTKKYFAVVIGRMVGGGSIPFPIREFGSGRMGVDKRKGKRSQTFYKVLLPGDTGSLVEVHPVTGRRHQIRVHFYALGHPILGDTMYGDPRPVGGFNRLMLHAQSLAFEFPTGTSHLFSVEPPPEFMNNVESVLSKEALSFLQKK
jgi:tRNA pseudouridine32 synthase / 23S rRNA pseudouridine746 synthase